MCQLEALGGVLMVFTYPESGPLCRLYCNFETTEILIYYWYSTVVRYTIIVRKYTSQLTAKPPKHQPFKLATLLLKFKMI